ncbi:MAG: toxin-antitoxin system HicB family antitoxin [Nocardioidaceae bacterium]
MDLTPYVDNLRHDLAAAASAGGPEAMAAAERLVLALDPAVRLTLMDALSQAAAEITAELSAGSIDVRLRGREPQFVVDVPTVPMQTAAPRTSTTWASGNKTAAATTSDGTESADETSGGAPDGTDQDGSDGAVARITLRIPESLKARAEELAVGAGHSLNSWIVNAVRSATRDRALSVDIDLSGVPFLDHHASPPGPGRSDGRQRGKRMTGWV